MINQGEISSNWLNQISKQYRNADKILVEKVIRALLLLEGLVKQKLPFVFKGGTALMLHFNSTKRLSIDIDIILPQEITNFDEILDEIIKEQGFLKWELKHRSTQLKIKKEHYMFFYTPYHKTNKDKETVETGHTLSLHVISQFLKSHGSGFSVWLSCQISKCRVVLPLSSSV